VHFHARRKLPEDAIEDVLGIVKTRPGLGVVILGDQELGPFDRVLGELEAGRNKVLLVRQGFGHDVL